MHPAARPLAGALGLGLRVAWLRELRATSRTPASWPIAFWELLAENYLTPEGVVRSGPPARTLEWVSGLWPVVLHSVGMGIADCRPLDRAHLRRIATLARQTGALWVTDHLCWSRAPGAHLHELLPLPRTMEIARYVAERARIVQTELEVPFGLENLSAYLCFSESTLTEAEFFSEVIERADVGALVDVNNLVVSGANQGEDPHAFLARIDPDRILQVHLAGHTRLSDNFRLDTHDQPVERPALDLLSDLILRAGAIPTVLERDGAWPPLMESCAELHQVAELPAWSAAVHPPSPEPGGPRPFGRSPLERPVPPPIEPPDPQPPAEFATLQEGLSNILLQPFVFRRVDPDCPGVDTAPGPDPLDRASEAIYRGETDPSTWDLPLLRRIGPNPGKELPERLALMHHQVQTRLISSAATELAHTARHLGDAAFLRYASEQLGRHPPISPLLQELVAAWEPPSPPAAAECFALDRALQRAFWCDPGPPLTGAADLTGQILGLQAGLFRMDLRYHGFTRQPPLDGPTREDGDDFVLLPLVPAESPDNRPPSPYLLAASTRPGQVRAWALSYWEARLLDLVAHQPFSLGVLVETLAEQTQTELPPGTPPLELAIGSLFHRAARSGWLQAQPSSP